MSCALCGIASGAVPPPGPAPLARGPFVVHAKPEPGAHAGWLLVVPRRHVEQVAELTDAEARSLGPLLRETADALRAETGAAKTYVACFAEVVPHLHFHVIARASDAPEDTRGPRAFLATAAESADEGARAALCSRVLARLQPADSRFRPLLLSGLLWPGAGQVVAGRRRLGFALAATTAVVCILLLRSLVAETLLRMPTDPVFFDDFGSLVALSQRLATEIRPALAPYLWMLLGLWLVGCVEAAVRIFREPR